MARVAVTQSEKREHLAKVSAQRAGPYSRTDSVTEPNRQIASEQSRAEQSRAEQILVQAIQVARLFFVSFTVVRGRSLSVFNPSDRSTRRSNLS